LTTTRSPNGFIFCLAFTLLLIQRSNQPVPGKMWTGYLRTEYARPDCLFDQTSQLFPLQHCFIANIISVEPNRSCHRYSKRLEGSAYESREQQFWRPSQNSTRAKWSASGRAVQQDLARKKYLSSFGRTTIASDSPSAFAEKARVFKAIHHNMPSASFLSKRIIAVMLL
jgi:hypothetical protein